MSQHSAVTTKPAWISQLPDHFQDYLGMERIDQVEIIIPDIVGTSSCKAMPAYKFPPDEAFFLPISLFYQTIAGEYVQMEIESQWLEKGVMLVPDMDTAVHWGDHPSAQIICDMKTRQGKNLPIAPRNVLRRILNLYAAEGLTPVVAPELEFYLTKPNVDPSEPVKAPVGRPGRKGFSSQVYSMAAVDEYGPVIDTIYDFAEARGLKIETVIQKGGAEQIEINLLHGDPVALADQVFFSKRTIREAALKNGICATFMAKPMRDEPASAMHIHQSALNTATGKNIFSDADGNATEAFTYFIGGSPKYLMQAVPLLAPYINSYRRITVDGQSAPANLEWAADNRTTGLRVPHSVPAARRLENWVIGMDCNPYLAIAASLACGYLGRKKQTKPRDEAVNEVRKTEDALPIGLSAALNLFEDAKELWEVLVTEFCQLFLVLKCTENEEYQREISPWERQHLLLNV